MRVVWEGVQVAEEEVVVKEKAEAATVGAAEEEAETVSAGMASSWRCIVHCKHPRCDTQCHTPA